MKPEEGGEGVRNEQNGHGTKEEVPEEVSETFQRPKGYREGGITRNRILEGGGGNTGLGMWNLEVRQRKRNTYKTKCSMWR